MTDDKRPEAEPSVPRVKVSDDLVRRLDEMGAPPTMATAAVYEAIASQPDLLRGWIELSWGMRMRSGAAQRLREIVIVRMGILVGAQFVRDAHERFARDAGVTDREIAALEDWRSSAEFNSAERAALALADGIHEVDTSDDVLDELARHFTPEERVELIITCGFYEMVPRVNNALRVG